MPNYRVQFADHDGRVLGAQVVDCECDENAISAAHSVLVSLDGQRFTVFDGDRCVYVHPPAANAPEEAEGATASPITAQAGGLAGLRVLLIEEDKEDGEVIVKALNEFGVKKIVWARTTRHAYRQLTEDKEVFPDVVILELAFAGTNGIQFLARLRASDDKDIKDVPAIVVTSVDSPSIYRRVTNQKISAYLRKPFASGQLLRAVFAATSGKILEPPLAFGRSWIDDVEDQEDAKGAPRRQSWLAKLFAPRKKKRRR